MMSCQILAETVTLRHHASRAKNKMRGRETGADGLTCDLYCFVLRLFRNPDRICLLNLLWKGGKGGFLRCSPRGLLRFAALDTFLLTIRPSLLRIRSPALRPPEVCLFLPLKTSERTCCAADRLPIFSSIPSIP